MEKEKVVYEAPTTVVVEIKTETGILTVSNYYENEYYEE